MPSRFDHIHPRSTVLPAASAPGDAGAAGVSDIPATGDHQHPRETTAAQSTNLTTGAATPAAVAATGVIGTATSLAHSDHVHPGLGLPIGLTGAVQAARFAGATTSGAPLSGTFAVGDYVVDRTGAMWVCTAAGTPGTWLTVGVKANPAGRFYNQAQQVLSNAVQATITSTTLDFTQGGMTFASNALTVPVAGVYYVSAAIIWQNAGVAAGAGGYQTVVIKTGSNTRVWGSYTAGGGQNWSTSGGSDLIMCAANDTLALAGLQNSGTNQGTLPGTLNTWLSASLVST